MGARSAFDAPSVAAGDAPRFVVGRLLPLVDHMSSRDPCFDPGKRDERNSLRHGGLERRGSPSNTELSQGQVVQVKYHSNNNRTTVGDSKGESKDSAEAIEYDSI